MTTGVEGGEGQAVQLAAVRHLAELGYEDPWDVAARRAAAQHAEQEQLRQAEEFFRSGDVPAAIGRLKSLAEADAHSTAARRLLAKAYYLLGRFSDADAELDWLQFSGVEGADLALLRAAVALRRRDYATALDQARYAKDLQPTLADADVIMAEASFRRGDLAAAERACCAVLAHLPQNTAAPTMLAAVALQRGQWEAAADWALQAIECDPGRWQAHCHLGRALVELHRPAEARVALENAARLAGDRVAPYFWLVRLCRATGDGAAAAGFRSAARAAISRRRARAAGT